jgi:hypothetical protein
MSAPYEGIASLAAAELFALSAIEETFYSVPDEDNYLALDDEDYLEAHFSAMDGDYIALGVEEAVEEEYRALREFELTQWSKPPQRPAAERAPPVTLTRAYATPEAALAEAAAAVA